MVAVDGTRRPRPLESARVRSRRRTSSAVTFNAVSAGKLAAGGITLSAPQSAGSAASTTAGEAAAAAASSALGGRTVQEYHHAHCVDTQKVPALNEDCWAVSLDPSGLTSNPPPGFAAQQASYLIALIDPATQTFIESMDGN